MPVSEPVPPFTAEAALTEAELDAFAAAMDARTRAVVPPPGARLEAAGGVLLGLAGGLLAVVLGWVAAADGAWIAMLLLVAFIAGMLAMLRAMRRYYAAVRRAQRASTGFLREGRRYALDEHGVAVQGETADAAWSWRALTAAEITRDLLLLRVGLVHGFAIPVRAFASSDEAAAAQRYAQARIEAARAGS